MSVAGSNRLLDAALEIQSFCRARDWRFCFIGGIAVQHWGEARLTRDADLTLFTGIGDEATYIDELLAHFGARVTDAREFALAHRVLLLRATNGIPIDLTLGALPFEERGRRRHARRGNRPRDTPAARRTWRARCVQVFADRPQDSLDVEGIVVKSGRLIDWDEVRRDLTELLELKGDTGGLTRLEELLARLS